MSQQPPPPPYGGPPTPPYGGPPGPYPQGPSGPPLGPPPGGMSNKAKFWIGVALTVPVMIVSSLVTGAGSAAVDAAGGDPGVGAALSGLLALTMLGLFVAACVVQRTRWFALGILAGTGILLILAAGACVVLLVALTQSYN